MAEYSIRTSSQEWLFLMICTGSSANVSTGWKSDNEYLVAIFCV